jgi:hypothetical protein
MAMRLPLVGEPASGPPPTFARALYLTPNTQEALMVRAKFKVTHKTSHMAHVQDSDGKYVEKEVGTVRLQPASGDENKTWSMYTPCGSIELTINNPPAYEALKLGESYFIDFTPAPRE